MKLLVRSTLSADEQGRWSRFVDDQRGGPQQLPDFVQWWTGLVPGAEAGGFCIAEDDGEWVGCGSFYRRGTAEGSTLEFPRGPVAADRYLPEFLEGVLDLFPGEHIIVSPYASCDEQGLERVTRLGFEPMLRRWIHRTVRVDLQRCPEEELFGGFAPATRRRIRSAQRAEAKVELALSEADCVWFAERNTRMAGERGLEPTPVPYVLRSCLPESGEDRHAGLFLMRIGGDIVSAALVMFTGKTAYYQKGYTDRVSAGTQFLHWEIMRWLRARGVEFYDFGGVEDDIAGAGVSRFKLGFGPVTTMFPALQSSAGRPGR